MPKFLTKEYRVSSFIDSGNMPTLSADREEKSFASTITDYEGLYINYGYRETSYPYTQQNLYSEEKETDVRVAVLENAYLYAEFLVDFGGRLWKLYDKKKQKDIIYTNDVIRFRNLAIRNAWFSGGVEWNCGIIGHSPFTCSAMYCAKVTGKSGEDVLRFYEFERVRSIFYQIDFWLDKNRLMTQVRITNPNDKVVPMYWWSNMATPEYEGGRVIVNAQSAYNNSDGLGVKKSSIPNDKGVDVSYPQNIPSTIDYFYRIPDESNKFIANVDKNGYGLLQFSSNRLKGRKLFSWGHLTGSDNWQNLLTDKAGYYVEIQAGLGRTQYECIPMPPKTSYCFSECYTLADLSGMDINAPYDEMINAVNNQINSIHSSKEMDALTEKNEQDISLLKGKVIYKGSGFGYLYNAMTSNAPKHLEFSNEADSQGFLNLYENGYISGNISFAFGDEIETLINDHIDEPDWQICYQKSLMLYDRRDFADAKKYCEKSFVFDNNLYQNHLYAHILYQLKDGNFTYFAKKAVEKGKYNYSLCESLIILLLNAEEYQTVIDCFGLMDEKIKSMPRLKMYLSKAYFEVGNAFQAEEILTSNGGLKLLDFREGDRFLDRLYRKIRTALYGENYKDIVVPKQFDFIVSDFKTD